MGFMAWEQRRRQNIFDLFNEFFDSLTSDFDDDFQSREEDIRRTMKPMRNVSGFSVRITQTPGLEPKVEVQRFGPEGLAKVEPQRIKVVEEQLAKLAPKKREEPKIQIVEKKEDEMPAKPVKFDQPQVAEGKDEKGKFVEILMPGIQTVDQVDLTILEQSIEVKAINQKDGHGYFWIVKIPPGAKKVTKLWATDRLRLYFN